MPQAFDHIVLASRDLAAQAKLYQALGFETGPQNRHDWGTLNRIIQLQGNFLELIGIAPGARLPPATPAPRQFSFGGFIGQYLTHREGFAMLAMASSDAKADARRFEAAGIGAFDPFHFGRKGTGPDGLAREVSFTLAFAHSPLIKEAGFFTCQHRQPENFWSPAAQTHPNTAQKLAGVVMTAEYPADHAEFLGHFLEQREMLSTSMGLEIDVPGGKAEVLTPLAARFRYGIQAGAEPSLAAMRIAVADMDAMRACLAAGGIMALEKDHRTIVPAALTRGATIIFEPLDHP